MNNTYPLVSIIIPTYNEEKNLGLCLSSINKQNYPKDLIEIIIVDDYSKDKTVEIAKKYGAKIFHSGKHHIERSKSIGISKAKGDLFLFIDADINLVSSNWLKKSVLALINNPEATGAQAIYWQYKKNHNIYNRYCELLGVNDPFVYMLGKRGVLSPFERKWINDSQLIKENSDYFLCYFSLKNLPTLGSQGYLVRKDLIMKSNYKPFFFHLDSTQELVEKGFNIFALMKLEVEHNYVDSFFNFHKKLYRNLNLFLKFKKYRRYNYGLGSFKFIFTVLLMITFIYPLTQSIVGYFKKNDVAWFLHPIFCFTVPVIYFFVFVEVNIRILNK